MGQCLQVLNGGVNQKSQLEIEKSLTPMSFPYEPATAAAAAAAVAAAAAARSAGEEPEAEKKAVVAGRGSSAVLALEPLHISEPFAAYLLYK